MKLAIVIATHNRLKLLTNLIEMIKLQINNPFEITIIIIDDGSTDGTEDFIKKNYPDIIYIKGDGNWWWTKCMNEGFKKAVELNLDFVLILNDDVEIFSNYLSILYKDYMQLPKNSILGSASLSIEKPYKIESAGTYKFIKWRFKFIPYYSKFKVVDKSFKGVHKTLTLSGRGTLIPTNIFNKIGYFDDKLIQYGSDDEFCFRANNNDIPVYISWNALLYNHTLLTSQGAAFKKESFGVFLKSFFIPYSVNSIKKQAYFYLKYGYKIFLPFFLIYFIVGTFKAYLFNYNKK